MTLPALCKMASALVAGAGLIFGSCGGFLEGRYRVNRTGFRKVPAPCTLFAGLGHRTAQAAAWPLWPPLALIPPALIPHTPTPPTRTLLECFVQTLSNPYGLPNSNFEPRGGGTNGTSLGA